MNNNIKIIREELGLTKTKLAEMTDLSIGYISHLEKGTRKNPTYKTMLKISKALNKDITDVFNMN